MSYTTLMLHLDAYSLPENLLHLSTNLAEKFDATLIGISSLAVRPPLVAEEMVVEGMTEDEVMEKLSAKEEWFRKTIGTKRQKIEWRSIVDFPTAALAREARGADLIIIGQSGKREGDAYSTLDPASTILKAGRPILVVPKEVASLRAEHVIIGWKESREARRAVQDALPFLQKAVRVTVVEICAPIKKETTWPHIDDVARYLGRHDINAHPEVIVSSEGSDGAQLTEFAEDRDADLLVTGAYGHSRLGEWIFGGMTRDLLTSSPLCCLMSH
jgi:nucleotide-binding universal stress UspA family protein